MAYPNCCKIRNEPFAKKAVQIPVRGYQLSVVWAVVSPAAHKEGEKMDTENLELEQIEQPGHAKSILTGLLVGGLVGAGTVLLFAPQAGAKTRAEVQQGVQHFRDQTTEKVKGTITQAKSKANQIRTDVKVKADELQHQGKDLIVKQLDRVSHAVESGKRALQESNNGKEV